MLHLIKLAVGIENFQHLALVQAQRLATEGHVRHLTRQRPSRAAEILAGGSLFWVIAGAVAARQRIVAIDAATKADGTPCAALMFDPALVAVMPRPMRPFQGWRYLPAEDAPDDIAANTPGADLPEALVRALRGLALL